jgi:hypothetical protein
MAHQRSVRTAQAFIDAFYSFDAEVLRKAIPLTDDTSRADILFYQGWAEGGNYEVITRHSLLFGGDTLIKCPVTVKDDLIGALQLDMHVTDTFHLVIRDGAIRSIETSSNDPPLFYEARKWVRENRPELTEIPCRQDENGGTPGDCCKAVVEGFRAFMEEKARGNSGSTN